MCCSGKVFGYFLALVVFVVCHDSRVFFVGSFLCQLNAHYQN